MENKPVLHSLGHAILCFLYVSGVAFIIFNGERIFGPIKTFLGPVLVLLLLVISASITGTLVLGRPILMYLDGEKKEAVKFFGYTLGWLILIALVALGSATLWK